MCEQALWLIPSPILYRGGRCNAVAAMAGGILKLHPRIVVENGAMNASKKYRGKIDSVIMDYVKDMEKDLKNARPERVFITHSGCKQGNCRESAGLSGRAWRF